MGNVNDRAVKALSEIKWAVVPGEADLPFAVALVLRVIRDDIAMAWQRGQINDLDGAQDLLNERIFNLTGRQTVTGDTT